MWYLRAAGCSCVAGACFGVSVVCWVCGRVCIGECVFVFVSYACFNVVIACTSIDNICIVHLIGLTVVQVAGKVLGRTYPIG